MACDLGITADIVSDCSTQPVGGAEDLAWIGNRNDFTFTKTDNKITNIVAVGAAVLYTLETTSKGLDVGHDLVVADKMANRYTHFAGWPQFQMTSAALKNLTDAEDIFIIVKKKARQTGGDGTFVAYGVETGLYKTSDTRRINTGAGERNVEYASRAGQEERYPEFVVLKTDEATTQTMLDSLVTPA